jgi:competence protein ComEA
MFDPAHRSETALDVPGSDGPDSPLMRPRPPRSPAERFVGWVTWFGVSRLVLTVIAVAVVAVGGFWLVRSPAPAVEATLPTVGASTPTATLSPPTTPGEGSRPTADTTAPPPVAVVVHVAGQVAVPGVYRLDPGGRVHEAIERAGGATAEADLDALNLAQALADGQRLYVPRTGEVDPAEIPVVSPVVPPVGEAPGTPTTAPSGPIDLNRAPAAELEQLPGVGPATASAIVDDRERNGPFASVDDLDRVPGIGPSKLDALRDLVTV